MNLTDQYINKTFFAENIVVGTKLKILEQGHFGGPDICKGTVGTVFQSKNCIPRCTSFKHGLCHGWLISMRIDKNPDIVAHSCYFKFCTLDNVPVIFKEE
jgi:hypothetical protein